MFDLQAHRGGAGLAPENTLAAFANSLDIGVSSIECDVHISADGVAVLSHERTYAGRIIPLSTAAELAPIATLPELIDLLHHRHADEVELNVETKFDVLHPDEGAPRERFVKVVLDVLRGSGMVERSCIQSFDWTVLRLARVEEPGIKLSAVTKSDHLELHQPGASPWLGGLDIDDFNGSIPVAVSALGFDLISPSHTIVTPAMVAEAHEAGLGVVPYTVDAAASMRWMIEIGVDGMITNRPDVLRSVLAELDVPLPRPYPRIALVAMTTEPNTGPTPQQTRRALARADRGAALDLDEATVLLSAREEDLERLCAIASRVRDAGLVGAGRPGVVTYSPKVFIPVTKLCRDRCHYCTFVESPGELRRSGQGMFLSPDEIVEIACQGGELGCTEALFTLGDRPEDRWPEARAWLDEQGYDSTLAYVRAMAIRVLEETGLLPHLNPGVMSWEEMNRLKPVSPSMGMMLETTSRRLFEEKGQAHYGSPDKDPDVRVRVLEDAGRLSVPFTTGLLIGIGENLTERAESIFELRRVARQFGHVQEVIIQNFRAKPDTAMRHTDDLGLEEYVATIAVSRIVLGPKVRLQAPPNLVDLEECKALLGAGVDDWGGVSPLTPDHVNPERPWPSLERLRSITEQAGFELRARLTVHPEYVLAGEPWIDPRVSAHVAALADDDGLVRDGVRPVGLRWQEPDGGFASVGRTDLHTAVDTEGRTDDRRSDFDNVYGDWESVREAAGADGAAAGTTRAAQPAGTAPGAPGASVDGSGLRGERTPQGACDAGRASGTGGCEPRGVPGAGPEGWAAPTAPASDPAGRAALAAAESDPGNLSDEHALTLMTAEGDLLEQVIRLADDLRRETVGDEVTYVVNRNINFTNVCYVGCRFCAFAQRRTDADAYSLSLDQVADRAEEAWNLGATEVCMQGGIDPELPGTAYFDLAAAVKTRVPQMHVHAFSPMEIVNGSSRTGLSFEDFLIKARESGLDTIPGTAAEILDDDVRWVLTKGKLPTRTWVEIVTTAHQVGVRSSSTMMYGHVDNPRHWVQHLRVLSRIQDTALDSGASGFTEFVPLPFVHHSAPIYLAGVARPGPTLRDNLAVHALARIMLHGRIDNIQTSWVKLGIDGTRAMLNAGANDLGGTLMEETISRMAGSEHGSAKTVEELVEIGTGIGRPVVQRTTTYDG